MKFSYSSIKKTTTPERATVCHAEQECCAWNLINGPAHWAGTATIGSLELSGRKGGADAAVKSDLKSRT